MFDELYESTSGRGIDVLGDHYAPPLKFRHGEWELVADMTKDPFDGDGQSVKVYELRCPARFFKIEAAPDPNSVGEPQPAFEIRTGSGDEMAHLIGLLAVAITQGMVGSR